MSAPRVLLIASKRGVRRAATRALVSVGWDIVAPELSREELGRRLDERYQLYLVDADMERDDLVWVVEQLERLDREGVVLLISSNLSEEQVVDLLIRRGVNNIIAKQAGFTAQDLLDETELIATCDKLMRRDIFGIEKYLPAHSVRIFEQRIERSDERRAALDALASFLALIDCHNGIRPMVLAVADELLMNAIFSAPRTPDGKPKYQDRDRSSAFSLEPEERVQFRYACDGRNVILSVGDQFGSFGRDTVMKYIGRGLMNDRASVEYNKGGNAGLGLYMIVHSITQLIFNIQPNARTEVIASFYVRSGVRAFKTSRMSLNMFFLS